MSELQAQLVGNGARIKGYNEDLDVLWSQKFDSGGTISGRWRGGIFRGKWWFEGDMMCIDYDYDDVYDGCWYMAIDGDSTKWWNADGSFWDRPNKVTYLAP